MVRNITQEKIDTIVSNLPDLISNFKNWWYDSGGGPSLYFYQKTISRVRDEDLETLLGDDSFIELLYATLTAWDMDSRSASLEDFEEFWEEITVNKNKILTLSDFKLIEMNEKSFRNCKTTLKTVYNNLDLMKTSKKLVCNSKFLHFTLPDLVTPMDRKNTVKYFYETKSTSRKRFFEIFDTSWKIAQRTNLEEHVDDEFNLSEPKVIDNAINSFMRDD